MTTWDAAQLAGIKHDVPGVHIIIMMTIRVGMYRIRYDDSTYQDALVELFEGLEASDALLLLEACCVSSCRYMMED